MARCCLPSPSPLDPNVRHVVVIVLCNNSICRSKYLMLIWLCFLCLRKILEWVLFQVTGVVLSCVYLGWFLSQSPFWLLAWWTRAFSLSWRKRLKIEPSREGELPQPSSASAWSCSTSLYSYILVWCSYYMVYSFKHLQEARLHHNVGGTNNNDINIILVVITSVGRVSSLQVWNRGLVPGSCDLNPIWHPFVETLQPDLFHKLKSVLISIKTFCP
jgi:hypothetical protein